MNPRLRQLLGPSSMMLVMIAVLCGLGVWQLRRLEWKRGILAAIDHAEAAPPVPLPPQPGRFEKVGVTGNLRPDARLLYGAEVRDTARGPMMGAGLIQPLVRAGALPILVDRGWVPETVAATIATPTGPVALSGYVRPPEYPGRFSARDDPVAHRFYTLDPAAMGRALGLSQVAPFTLILLGPDVPGTYPAPTNALPRPPNDHLSYAITWFGLALVLLVMFATWARKAVR